MNSTTSLPVFHKHLKIVLFNRGFTIEFTGTYMILCALDIFLDVYQLTEYAGNL